MEGKRKIRKDRYGNWVGYIGRERITTFGDSPECSAELKAIDWLNGAK